MTAQRKYSRETFKAFTRETPQSREFCYFSDALHGRYSLRRHRSFSFVPFSGLDWKETLDRRRNEAVEDLKGILFFQLWLTHAFFFLKKMNSIAYYYMREALFLLKSPFGMSSPFLNIAVGCLPFFSWRSILSYVVQ